MRFLLVCVFALLVAGAMALMPASQKAALETLYEATNGTYWKHRNGWLYGDPCQERWYGVQCGGGDKVSTLSLRVNNLDGTLPSSIFTDLPDCKWWFLNDNKLTGTLGTLHPEIDSLLLYNNKLTGPLNYYETTSLTSLRVENNSFTGKILPWKYFPLLKNFMITNNLFDGEFPGGHCEVTKIYVQNNTLTGAFPWVVKPDFVPSFDARYNNFTCPLPEWCKDLCAPCM